MIKQVLATREREVRADTTHGRLQMLANLLRKDCIGYRTLLRNVADIVQLDEGLIVNAVLLLTDKERASSAGITQIEYHDALVAVRCACNLRTAPVLIEAISEMMQADW